MSRWYRLNDAKPDDGAKIMAIASLPTGPLVMQYGWLSGDWFEHPTGSKASLSTIVVWRPASSEEVAQFENEANWLG